jgi:hypothetical protein
MKYLPNNLASIFGPQNYYPGKEKGITDTTAFLQNVVDRKSGGSFSIKDYREEGGAGKSYLDTFGNENSKLIDAKFISFDKKTNAASFRLYDFAGSNVSYSDTRDIAVFLNSMPNTAMTSLVPYVEIEFEFRYRTGQLGPGKSRPPGLMRFLLGPERHDNTPSNANYLMDEGRIQTKDLLAKVHKQNQSF